LSGLLSKRPIGHESAKWSKRFFVVKDGFLLYYPESAQKVMDKTQSLGLHPKGILPLGGCTVESYSDPGHPFCLQITAEESTVKVFVAADSDYERNRWIRVIEQAARITWRNAQLGDAMIQQLERRGMEINQQKQEYLEKLNVKTAELASEAQRSQELQVINDELVKEKTTVERLAAELQAEHEIVKKELECKMLEVRQLATAQQQLIETSQDLQKNLEELAAEKQRVYAELRQQQAETDELSRDRHTLCHVTDVLATKLKEIETRMAELAEEKLIAEGRLMEHKVHTEKLLAEKHEITQVADDLQESLRDLARQKELSDSELREEISARLAAEKRLREAEESLARIEARLQQHETNNSSVPVTSQQSQQQQQQQVEDMMTDVKTLKKYFENVLFDVKLDANKTLMIKRSIQVRKDRRTRLANTVVLDQSAVQPQFQEFLRRQQRIARTGDVKTTFGDYHDVDAAVPASPNDVGSGQEFARLALTSPLVRNSCIEVLRQIDSFRPN
jgi:myosin heavy subunit